MGEPLRKSGQESRPLFMTLRKRIDKLSEYILSDNTCQEIRRLLALAWAIIPTAFLQFFPQTTSTIMCGHLSAIELGSVGLANSFMSIFGIYIINGLATAFDTFFSQSYGAKSRKAVNVYLLRALILANLVYLCDCCIFLNIEPLLIAIGQDNLKAMMASEYLLILLPGLWFDFNFQTLAKFHQGQGSVLPPLVCVLIGNIVNVLSQYIAIYVYGLGYHASAVCQSVSFGVMMILDWIYICTTCKIKELCADCTMRDGLEGWGAFMRLGIPGIFLILFQSWCWEAAIVAAGVLGTVQMGAQAILYQIQGWGYILTLGMGIAITIRVGQQLGANNPEGARAVFILGLMLNLITALLLAILEFCLIHQLPFLFTDNAEIGRIVQWILPLGIVLFIISGWSQAVSGALRGCGHQLAISIVNFGAYNVICLPIAFCLTFLTPLKIFGFWIGLGIGFSCQSIIVGCFLLWRVDWKVESEKAKTVVAAVRNGSLQELQPEAEDEQTLSPIIDPSKEDSAQRHYQAVERSSEQKQLDSDSFRRLLCRRLATCLIVVCLFLGAVALHIFVPKSWRPLCTKVNNQTLLMRAAPLPYCNASRQVAAPSP